MTATIVVCAATFLALTSSIIFFPSIRIKRVKIGSYWVIALVGAIVLFIFQLAPVKIVYESLTADSAINPLKILALFFSMTFLSVYLDEAGLFAYLAQKAVKIVGSSQTALFAVLYALAAVLTVFTSNDIVILTLTPFICFFCKNTEVNPVPYLVGEFAAANTWSMMLIIGNPTNIYLATSAGIDFMQYFSVMALPTLAAGAVEFSLILLIFGKRLKAPLKSRGDELPHIEKADVAVGLFHLAVCLVFLIISSYVGLEMWLISVACAASLAICVIILRLIKKDGWRRVGNSFKRLPRQLIPFVLSMFVIVVALDYQGVNGLIAGLLGDKNCVWTYGLSSFFASNLINNIPMSMLFSGLPTGLPQAEYFKAIYASIVGSNIGAFLTPIGALAGIMFTGLAERYKVNYTFRHFVGYGAIISLPTLAAALLVLSLV